MMNDFVFGACRIAQPSCVWDGFVVAIFHNRFTCWVQSLFAFVVKM